VYPGVTPEVPVRGRPLVLLYCHPAAPTTCILLSVTPCSPQGASEYVWIRVDGEGERVEFERGGVSGTVPLPTVRRCRPQSPCTLLMSTHTHTHTHTHAHTHAHTRTHTHANTKHWAHCLTPWVRLDAPCTCTHILKHRHAPFGLVKPAVHQLRLRDPKKIHVHCIYIVCALPSSVCSGAQCRSCALCECRTRLSWRWTPECTC
jgi:hypothetical protein